MFSIGAFEPLKQGSLPLTRDSGGNGPVSTALSRSAKTEKIKHTGDRRSAVIEKRFRQSRERCQHLCFEYVNDKVCTLC